MRRKTRITMEQVDKVIELFKSKGGSSLELSKSVDTSYGYTNNILNYYKSRVSTGLLPEKFEKHIDDNYSKPSKKEIISAIDKGSKGVPLETVDRIIGLYQNTKLSAIEISKETGVSAGFIWKLVEYVTRRNQPGSKISLNTRKYIDIHYPEKIERRLLTKLDFNDIDQVIKLSDANSLREVSRKTGVSLGSTVNIVAFYRHRNPKNQISKAVKEYITENYSTGGEKKEVEEQCISPETEDKMTKREVSILWGLIKIKY